MHARSGAWRCCDGKGRAARVQCKLLLAATFIVLCSTLNLHWCVLLASSEKITRRNHWITAVSQMNGCYSSRCPSWLGLPDTLCKNTGHFDLSSVPDLSCVLFHKWDKVNREKINIVKSQLIISLYFGWFITLQCVCDVPIAPKTSLKELSWQDSPLDSI